MLMLTAERQSAQMSKSQMMAQDAL